MLLFLKSVIHLNDLRDTETLIFYLLMEEFQFQEFHPHH